MHATPIILMKFMFSFADNTIPKRKSIAAKPSFLFIAGSFRLVPALAGGAGWSFSDDFRKLVGEPLEVFFSGVELALCMFGTVPPCSRGVLVPPCFDVYRAVFVGGGLDVVSLEAVGFGVHFVCPFFVW